MYQSGDTPLARLRGLVSGQPNLAGLLPGVSVAAVVLAGEVMQACADGCAYGCLVCLPYMSALYVCLICLRYRSQVMQACADGHAARAPAEVVGLCAVLEALDKGERCYIWHACCYIWLLLYMEVVGLCAVLEALDKGERYVCTYACIYSICIFIDMYMS